MMLRRSGACPRQVKRYSTPMKKIRLDHEVYHECGYPCQITIRCVDGTAAFRQPEITHHCMDLLESICKKYDFFLSVYCFMPDHLHFIASLRGERSIFDLLAAFKSLATRNSRAFGFKGRLFQPRFHDHFIRTPENYENAIRYILNNPVRWELVLEYGEYPFSKCFL